MHWTAAMFEKIKDCVITKDDVMTCGFYPDEHIEGLENTWTLDTNITTWFYTHIISIHIRLPKETQKDVLKELSSAYTTQTIGQYILLCEKQNCKVAVLMKTINHFVNMVTFGYYLDEMRSSIVYETGKAEDEIPTYFGDLILSFYHT
jgi:hypothetical protein